MNPRRTKSTGLAMGYNTLRADFAAARHTRHRTRPRGLAAMGSGADYHYQSVRDYLFLIEWARAMDRNDLVVGQVVDRAVTNTVQNGFRLNAQTPDEKLNKDLEDRWNDWADDPDQCDVAGELSFPEMERLAFRHTLVDGDLIALGLKSGELQLVEAHRVRSPVTVRNVVHGVLLDQMRVRREYWITKDDVDTFFPRSSLRVGDMRKVPTRDDRGLRQVFHVYNPRRVSQTRGVTAFAPIFDTLGMVDDVLFAKLVQAKVVSCFGVFHSMVEGGELSLEATQTGEKTTETRQDGSTKVTEELSPGMEVFGVPGEKLEGFSPNVPNAEFFPHMKMMLTLVGVNLGVPLVLVLLDASETNFSGYRGAVDQARLGFRDNQRGLIRRFHRPVYRFKLAQWVKTDHVLRSQLGTLGARSFMAAEFEVPGWTYIDPAKDVKADRSRLEANLTSPRRLHSARGMRWERVQNEIVEDNALLIETAITKADALTKAHPETPIAWQDLANMRASESPQVVIESVEVESSNG